MGSEMTVKLLGLSGSALTLPAAVYATEADFSDYQLLNTKIIARTQRATAEAALQLRTRRSLPAAFRAIAN